LSALLRDFRPATTAAVNTPVPMKPMLRIAVIFLRLTVGGEGRSIIPEAAQ
jgi:hypothetical protein